MDRKREQKKRDRGTKRNLTQRNISDVRRQIQFQGPEGTSERKRWANVDEKLHDSELGSKRGQARRGGLGSREGGKEFRSATFEGVPLET